jgi:hypothetical protein
VTASSFVTNTASITLSSTANGFTNGNYATIISTLGAYAGSVAIQSNNGSVVYLTPNTTPVYPQASSVPFCLNFAFAFPQRLSAVNSQFCWQATCPPYTTNTCLMELRYKKIQ